LHASERRRAPLFGARFVNLRPTAASDAHALPYDLAPLRVATAVPFSSRYRFSRISA
jgi:hypothetical protein